MGGVADRTRAAVMAGTARAELGAELRRAYEDGATVRALAAAHHRSYSMVHRLLTEAGAVFRARGGNRR